MALGVFKKMLGIAEQRVPRGPKGCRAYVIGDVHGRLDLLVDLMRQIEADMAQHPNSRNYMIFLGDLIDRGPDSAGVIEFLARYKPPSYTMIFLMGNHEETYLKVLDGDVGALVGWFRYGGKECVQSYGVTHLNRVTFNPQAVHDEFLAAVPPKHRDFVRKFDDSFRFGDYLCVHAGVRPGIPLEQQDEYDLRWIRDEFMNSTVDHGFVAVHGHTVVEAPEERPNRISIDTGAWATGRLTALVIDGTDRQYLRTTQPALASQTQ